MANISRGITEDSLLSLVNWHMNIENIYAGNARILDLSSQLALVKMQQKNQSELHTSSDRLIADLGWICGRTHSCNNFLR